MRETLIAIDGNSLLHRAYYALPAMTSRDGAPTGAVHGFLSMLLKLVERRPDYLVVAFDLAGPTFRHKEYADYKAGRRETPEDLRRQFPLLQEILKEMGIAVSTAESYEADDILGTYAKIAGRKDVAALLVTGDRDALQLISPTTHVLLTKKGISETAEMDEAALMDTYGLTPERMKDLKGLMGDTSDNIPGIPGVGEKTALKLLHEYGSMEDVLKNGENIKGKLGEKITENVDQARLSYRLGTIDCAAPVKEDLSDIRFIPEHMQHALSMLRKYQLNTIAKRLPEAGGDENGGARLEAPPHEADVTSLNDMPSLRAAVEKIRRADYAAVHAGGDTLSLAATAAKGFRVCLSGTLLEPGLEANEVFAALKPLFEEEKPALLLYDAKKWMHTLHAYSTNVNGLSFDAMIADYLLNATRPAASFEAIVQERLPEAKVDACALMRLSADMRAELAAQELEPLYEDVELPLISVLYDMEETGFNIDIPVLHELEGKFGARINELAAEIYELAGEEFNILSTKQLGAVLFDKLGLPAQKKTKTGYSTDADVLEKLMDMHPIVPLLQEYRFLTKLKSTFVDGLLSMVSHTDGRVHTSFNQNVTATGRISSTEPNLQNIPVRTELGREIRKAFIASEGNVLVGGDYSQIELRLLAHISGDEAMIETFREGVDIHTRTASEVFAVPLGEVTSAQRSAAKAVNFGIVYGISDFGLARNLHISRAQAGEYIARYLDRYPGVQAYMKKSVADGGRDGYVKTLLGRRRDLPELKSSNYNTRSFGERVALNMPIQGTAADIIKLAMVRVHRALFARGLQTKLILQVHDELILDAPPGEAEEASALLLDCMQNAMQLKVPLTVDVKTGHSWYDTK